MQVRQALTLYAALPALATALVALSAAAQVPTRARGVRTPTRVAAAPTIALPPAPVVTEWSPREQAHPGQVLTIRGSDFRPDDVRVRIGTGTRSVALQVVRATDTQIEVAVPEEYTGWEGAPLTVSHRGTAARELDADYRILHPDAVFSGASLWHVLDSPTTDIFARGTVTVRLRHLEFAQSGSGTYAETVRLVTLARKYDEECTDGVLGTGEREVHEWRWSELRPSREITWRRLADGRIEIRDVGVAKTVSRREDVLATVDRDGLQVQYSTLSAGPHYRPYTDRGLCEGLGLHSSDVPPIRGVPFRLVEWSLARRVGG